MTPGPLSSKLILVTGNRGFFGQTRKPWVSMDADQIQRVLETCGFEVERRVLHELVNATSLPSHRTIFYTFSQKPNRRRYICDFARHLDDGTNALIPSYDLLLCHENKGYQELYKRRIGLPGLETYYLSSKEELGRHDIRYPVVFKTLEGSNAKGVFLARSRPELERLIDRGTRKSLITRLDLLRRKHFRRRKTYKEYPDYSNEEDWRQYREYALNEINFLVQVFVPGLRYDYRVLVLFDKYYVTKRHIPEGDFRASGAKRFDFDFEPDPGLLDYARGVYGRFDTPFLSMDVGASQDGYHLFEFQALHFGLNVFVKGGGYYIRQGEDWVFVEARSDIETEIATALAKYIRSRST